METLVKLAKFIRYLSLVSTSKAGSGHPTSSMSATDLMTVLLFDGFFKYDLDDPKNPANDRLIFSKGHASPLFYSLWAAAGAITEEEIMTLRKFGSRLEGHPTLEFPYTEVPTGSLGQGLSVGVGMAINAKYLDKTAYRTFVLLGDSEMAEGSVWEAIQIGAYYKLDSLVAILDVNRLGQRGETMYGHNVEAYQKRISSFGWETLVADGHNLSEIQDAYKRAFVVKDKPVMIIAKTVKGKGVSFLEDKNGWHGKALKEEDLKKALVELGEIDHSVRGRIKKPDGDKSLNPKSQAPNKSQRENSKPDYKKGDMVATRRAYGNALVRLAPDNPNLVVLDAEVSNSTYAQDIKKVAEDRFFEMYIAEQNMVGTGLGLSRRGKIPFVSTFAAFFTRAYDQIRMAGLARANMKFVGSHAGVSIGEDGSSQMGLEDIAMFRTIFGSHVLYPSDAVSAEKLVEKMLSENGMFYMRTTRAETPVLYDWADSFEVGGSKVHKVTIQSSKVKNDKKIVIIGAGITLHEALAVQQKLALEDIETTVVDCYSVKPIDEKTLKELARNAKAFVVVEDHYEEGGIGDGVTDALFGESVPVHKLAVRKMPRSGKPKELLDYEEISSDAIVKKVRQVLGNDE